MDLKDIKSATARECQRHLFIQSLYRELDKASENANTRNSMMVQRANRLLFEDRFSKDACVDMLMIEGFSGDLARQYIESVASTKDSDTEATSKYDYCFEDHKGRIFTGRELDEIIEASSDEQAEIVVRNILASFDPPVNLLSITKVS